MFKVFAKQIASQFVPFDIMIKVYKNLAETHLNYCDIV